MPWPSPSGYPIAVIIDVSRSKEENDIKPSRIEATRDAALAFVRGLPRSTKVTLVTFGNYASVVVPLTADRPRLEDAIRNLTTQLRTRLGDGLVEGIREVAGETGSASPRSGPIPGAPPSGSQPTAPAPSPDRPRAIAVLMSDGRASDGVPPLEAAGEAKRRGVRVYTVGVGTYADPSTFRSGFFGVLDEPTLQMIAAQTGGEYFRAAEAGRLREIYRHLARTIGWERRPQEVTALAAGAVAALLVLSLVLQARIAPIR
jgi:Ca-activated chloride channel family protein